MRWRWVLAVVVAGAVLIAGGMAVTAEETSDTNLELDELQQDGTSYSNSPDSVRIEDSQMFWVVHWPAGISGSPGDPEDDYWEYLSPSDVVDRNSVWLRTINLEEQYEVTVNVATYTVGEREVSNSETNTTTTEQYAQNLTVSSHEVSLTRGWVMEEISLPQTDQRQQVTMWVEGSDDLRWTFEHHSVATTQELPFSSWGGLLRWSALVFMLPLGIGGVVALYGSKRVIQRTGKGPGWGYGPWIGVYAIIAMATVAMFWGDVTRLLVEYPLAMALYILSFLFVLMLETFEENTKLVRFERDQITERTRPSGEEGVDQLGSDEKELIVVDHPDHPARVASNGLLPFLARLATNGAATLRTIRPGEETADYTGETDTKKDPMRSRATVDIGRVDERVYVHSASPEVVDYRPEGWEFSMPELEDMDDYISLGVKLVAVGVLVAVTHAWIAGRLGALVALGLGAAWIGMRPTTGFARVWPAPVHYRSARATAMKMAEEASDEETLEREREQRIQEKVTKQKDVYAAADKQDKTLVESMMEIEEDQLALDDQEDPSANDEGSNRGGEAHADD